LINAYKQSNYDIWCALHRDWPMDNNNEMLFNKPDKARQIFRRVITMTKSERITPNGRVQAFNVTFWWYPIIAPEMVKNNLEALTNMLPLIDGNIKYAVTQVQYFSNLAYCHYSTGNIKLFWHYVEKIKTVRFDSEALEDQKAAAYESQCGENLWLCLMKNNFVGVIAEYEKCMDMQKLFPNTTIKYPQPFIVYWFARSMSYMYVMMQDWEAAINCIKQYVAPPGFVSGSAIVLTVYSHVDIVNLHPIFAIVYLYEKALSDDNEEDVEYLSDCMKIIRKELEKNATNLPGTHKCAGMVTHSRITVALKDRPFAEQFKKLEEALAYSTELDCLPMDTLLLEAEIAIWKGDINGLNAVIEKYKNMEYGLQVLELSKKLEKLKTGELKAVELDFVPENLDSSTKVLTDQEQLAQIEQAILDAKAEMATASNAEANNAARAKAKALKKEKKALQKKINEAGNAKVVDQAKIDETKSKIADARARQNQAFDDDDDDAEEAAAAEVNALLAQLEALNTGKSIPQQKLEDAKKIDAEINESEKK